MAIGLQLLSSECITNPASSTATIYAHSIDLTTPGRPSYKLVQLAIFGSSVLPARTVRRR
jgi:hypothetical protein